MKKKYLFLATLTLVGFHQKLMSSNKGKPLISRLRSYISQSAKNDVDDKLKVLENLKILDDPKAIKTNNTSIKAALDNDNGKVLVLHPIKDSNSASIYDFNVPHSPGLEYELINFKPNGKGATFTITQRNHLINDGKSLVRNNEDVYTIPEFFDSSESTLFRVTESRTSLVGAVKKKMDRNGNRRITISKSDSSKSTSTAFNIPEDRKGDIVDFNFGPNNGDTNSETYLITLREKGEGIDSFGKNKKDKYTTYKVTLTEPANRPTFVSTQVTEKLPSELVVNRTQIQNPEIRNSESYGGIGNRPNSPKSSGSQQ